MSAPPDNALGGGDADEESNKRAALAGQWRTPPLPVFPTASSTQEQPDSHLSSNTSSGRGPGLPAEVPNSAEDYQKALQEAYRRGAEAAAAMAAAHGVPAPFLASAASCPDFQIDRKPDVTMMPPPPIKQQQQEIIVPNPLTMSRSETNMSMPPPPPTVPSSLMSKPMVSSSGAMLAASSSPTISSLGHPLAAAPTHSLTQQQQQQQQQQTPSLPPPSQPLPPHAPSIHHHHQFMPHVGFPPPFAQHHHHHHPPQQRSMSLPDMTSYGAKQEEEKRQKRLARNRASARLRRLRKKNLVDAYETEVGILEKTLEQLQVHEWGTQDNPRALVEALSMDRGQQVLTTEERKQTATDILEQQLSYVNMLEEMMQEQYVLQQLQHDPALGDLKDALGLSEEQIQQLASSSSGWQDEWDALQTVKTSLQAMKDNDWLWNEGCTGVSEEFTSILHKNQISKFLLWADHNVEAIDELDIVNAPTQIAQGPVFHFGVNTSPEGLLDEERTQGE